ncbi:DUF6286 domain-containing protein [Allokutzneria albata]|uniref:DUF6286 domain-containing protein n=1 Tax=Allokutzneria albata TaxID=211114 RepID=A0A1G9VMJ5_ALLAB|nr:DUF6286 domain-containing protein [Allokutzneria albata]SDM73399.1 hypothetical protein SAMN04489726_3125 [Allokutzneria albata]
MRLLLRLLSTVLGLAVAAAGAVLVVEMTWSLARPGAPELLVPWRQWLTTAGSFSWSRAPVLWLAGGVLALGLLLLLVAATARRRDVRLSDPADDVVVTTSPRSLARLVGVRVRAAEGVSGATVTATGKKVKVRATGRSTELRPQLTELVQGAVADLPMPRHPAVRVAVTAPNNRRETR